MKNSIAIALGGKIEIELHTLSNGFIANLGLKDANGNDY